MKVGDTVPVTIAGQTVGNASVRELGDGTATLVVPAMLVVMATRTELSVNTAQPEGAETIITGVEGPPEAAEATVVGGTPEPQPVAQTATETATQGETNVDTTTSTAAPAATEVAPGTTTAQDVQSPAVSVESSESTQTSQTGEKVYLNE